MARRQKVIQFLCLLLFQPFSPTIEDIYVANVDTDRGTRERIRFIDTEGIDDDRVKEIPRHLLTIADGFIIVYSIDDEHSFQIAEVIRKDIERSKEKKEVRFEFEDQLHTSSVKYSCVPFTRTLNRRIFQFNFLVSSKDKAFERAE